MTHPLISTADFPASLDLSATAAAFAPGQTILVELPAAPTSPEIALLLACLRWPLSEDARARITTLAAADIDWTAFVSLVTRHRVFGLVEHGLRSSGVTVPEPQGGLLRERANHTSWSELILAGELRAMQKDLRARGVQPTVLKGLALSMKAYGRLGLRYNRDIDILVSWAGVAPACDVLQARGYHRIEPPANAVPAEVKRWIRRQKDIVYQHPSKGLVVEIHWRLFDNPHLLRFEDNGRRDMITISADFTVETLPADLDLIFICAHGAHHAWSRLKWIADVNAIFSQMPPGEILRVYRAAHALNAHRMMAQALILCASLLGLAIPAEIMADWRADWRIRILARVARHVILSRAAREIEDSALGSTPKNIAHYLLADGARYFVDEMLFDLTDLSGTRVGNAPLALVPVIRIYLWFVRHLKISLKSQAKMKP
jgi:hypothetical protein